MGPVFLVTGATGRQGGSTARLLLGQNVSVRALVRNRSSAAAQCLQASGVELFEGDFNNQPIIKAALQGVTGLFLNLFPTPDPDEQIRQGHYFIEAAQAAGVKSVVLSTALWTGDRSRWGIIPDGFLPIYYAPKAAIEDGIRTAGFPSFTILRPSILMHNYLLPDSCYHFPELSTEATLAHAHGPSVRMPHFNATDVGKFASKALLHPERFNGHEIELGYQNLTPNEAAEILSRVSGQVISTRRRTEEEIKQKVPQLPTIEFQLWANQTDITIDGSALAEKYGISLTSFEHFLQTEKSSLQKSVACSGQ